MANVILQNVTRRFGAVIAVDNISLEVHDHESIALLGPSGCGKTTILRMISGLDNPTEGSIFINTRLVNNVPPKERDIAMVFQNYALYPHMTVYENIAFGLRTRGMSKQDIELRIDQVTQMLEIKKLLRRKPKELSGGEKQRTALARAIARNPEVFLMDEPMSNLDAKLRAQTRRELIKLNRKIETTTIYVTHDQTEAMTLGHRVVVMNKGKIIQVGTPKDIYDKPNSVFVGGFIGNPPMNFFRANVKLLKEEPFLFFEDNQIPVPKKYREAIAAYINLPLIIGIRPESISLELTKTKQGVQIPVKAEVVETLGADNNVTLLMGNNYLISRTDSRNVIRISGNYLATWDPMQMHLFDADTELSILQLEESDV